MGFGQRGLEALEDVQLGIERLCRIQVLDVATGPAERCTRSGLKASQVDTVGAHELYVLVSEIIANDRDDAHVGEVARCDREIGCGAAKLLLTTPFGSFDGVVRNRSHRQDVW